jgi:hypothetical protein
LVVTSDVDLSVVGSKNTITWAEVDGAARYRIYKRQTGLYGYIGEVDDSVGQQFIDDNIAPDLSITPPVSDSSLLNGSAVTFNGTEDLVLWPEHGLTVDAPVVFFSDSTLPTNIELLHTYYVFNPSPDAFQLSETQGGTLFNFVGNGTAAPAVHSGRGGAFPGAVSYFEQRRCLAGALQKPQDLWMTASGTEYDLSFSLPIQDDDRISVRIAAREAGIIRHIMPTQDLLLLTGSAEYRVTPLNEDAVTPSSISVRPQSFIGAAAIQPVVVNANILFAAARGGHLRELGYQNDRRGYVTGDVSIRASHLFDGEQMVQLAYARAPVPIVWAVSSSGDLLGLTYLPEEGIGAWHHHTTDGTIESCAVVAEGPEDHLYVVVKRDITGKDPSLVRYVERMAIQSVDSIDDAFFVDSGATYSGAAATTITGLDHLEGKTVNILADGLVVTPQVVTSGQITLTTAASKVHVGLPYTAQLQTLPITMQFEAFGRGRKKNINAVDVRLFESGAFEVGPSTTALVPSFSPAAGVLGTGPVAVVLIPSWSDDGQVFVQQDDPLPFTIVSMSQDVSIGG